jgi:hypothetical protein
VHRLHQYTIWIKPSAQLHLSAETGHQGRQSNLFSKLRRFFFFVFQKIDFWLLLFWSHSVERTMGKEHPPPLCICTCDISFHVLLRLKRAGRNKDTVGDAGVWRKQEQKIWQQRQKQKAEEDWQSHPHLWLLVYRTALTSCPQRTANFLPLVSEVKPQSNRADVCSQIKWFCALQDWSNFVTGQSMINCTSNSKLFFFVFYRTLIHSLFVKVLNTAQAFVVSV